jgi:neutral amino acid transport system ATP-binding protein
VHRQYGGLIAVDVDHVEIQRGLITALIGPNGAGKSTFFNLLTGFDEPDHGRWTFDGEDVTGRAGHKLARAGMVRTFQLTKSLSRLSVMENMKLGAQHQIGEHFWSSLIPPTWRGQEKANEERADELLGRFRLDHMRDGFAGNLSGGQRKLLEMARALMADPKLIMLDEPMAGVNPALTQSLLGHIKSLRDEGRTVLFVEHDMDVVHDISDWVIVMAEGRVIAEGTADAIGTNTDVIDAYLGAHHDLDLGAPDEL